MIKTHGIHHISSMVGHAQKNIDFYAGVLGYRLVKQTLNFDDSNMYHLYYGNKDANSGLVTTFPMNNTREGVIGSGQVAAAGYGLRKENFDFWKERLRSFGIKTYEYTRFNKRRLGFQDLDGLEIELIETDKGFTNQWEFNGINQKHAIIGIENAIIYSGNPEATKDLLTNILGYEVIDEDPEHYLLKITDELGGILELSKNVSSRGAMGTGTVHHIAFRVLDEEIQQWFDRLTEAGYHPTEVKNRKYFKSIYFREKGGLLIELATNGPGMGVDEDLENLGTDLKIPPHFENKDISDLMPIEVREVKELKGYGYRNRYEYELLQERELIRQQIKELKSLEQLTTQQEEQLNNLKNKLINKGDN